MRERIILETIGRVAVVGPMSFNVKDVCASLGISNSLINHHFGNRDKMLAEITERVYADYVRIIWQVSDEAGPDGVERLRAWMNASVDWNVANSGWALLLNYPVASLEITKALDDFHREEMRLWAEYNLARLTILVRDVLRNQSTEFVWKIGELPAEEIMADQLATSLAGTVGWATHGLAVWQSGRHLPTSGGIPELIAVENQMRLEHIERIIRLITSDIA
jgi:AcrR family transcriptional regulator